MLNRLKHGFNLVALFVLPPFELFEPTCQFLVRSEKLAQADERAHNGNVHFDRAPAVENAGEHRDPLLAKGVGAVTASAAPLV